jgi:hypothetical protein
MVTVPSGLGVIWILSLVLLFGACLLVLRFARPDAYKINAIEITLVNLQLIAVFSNFVTPWPTEVTHRRPCTRYSLTPNDIKRTDRIIF